MTYLTDATIDPAIRLKAEKILEFQSDRINLTQLETIDENGSLTNEKLTSKTLQTLPIDNVYKNAEIDSKVGSKIKSI